VNWIANKRMSRVVLAASAAALAASACSLPKPAKPPAPLPDAVGQNWSATEKRDWWFGSQGSRLIPAAWLLALEAPDSTVLFMEPEHINRFGYIPDPRGGRFPIGFAADVQSDRHLDATNLDWFTGQDDVQPWIGLNCAACHTNRITLGDGYDELIDGAPTMADFQGFTDALLLTMQQTRKDDAKWKRFENRVVAPRRAGETDDSRVETDKGKLDQAYGKLLQYLENIHEYNVTDGDYGYGRLDAVGHILNKVAFLNGADAQFRDEPDAPVSYPFIWNANQHDFVQWNGLVPNQKIPLGKQQQDIGALVRNTSEVIGVFAEVVTRQYPDLNGYPSSVKIRNLMAMEDQLGRLMSPAWPAQFGAVDRDGSLFKEGKRLFERACADCHVDLDRRDLVTPIKAQMTPIWGQGGVGTDPGMVCNTFTVQAKAGLLQGTRRSIFAGDPLPARAPNAAFLQTQAVGAMLRQKKDIIGAVIHSVLGIPSRIERVELQAAADQNLQSQPKDKAERLADCEAAARSPRSSPGDLRTLAYKARPLNGIWATAPYLHNGSIRSLYQLLLPPERRETRFWVGNHEFDTREVGFVNGPSAKWPNGSWFNTHDVNGPIHGNSNAGHDYQYTDPQCKKDDKKCERERPSAQPRDFTDPERWALIEYMKSL
jgi:hypothetical protein